MNLVTKSDQKRNIRKKRILSSSIGTLLDEQRLGFF